MSQGAGKIHEYLAQGDYFSEKDKVQGQWFGKSAERLGLQGEVNFKDFEAVRECVDPKTGEFIRARRGADRLDEHGNKVATARNLYDFTTSAIKSASLIYALGKDDRIKDWHEKAVKEMLEEMEHCATCEVQTLGRREIRKTGNIVAALYTHETSRELDPQLHTHIAVGNMTFDKEEDRWKALHVRELFQRREYLTEVYRNAFARELMAGGYELEKCYDSQGNETFRIKGITKEMEDFYSQRSSQREKAIADFVEEKGRRPTKDEVKVLMDITKADKMYEVSKEEVFARQWARLYESPNREKFVDQLASVRAKAAENEVRGVERPDHDPAVSVQYAIEHTFARKSVEVDFHLKTEALKHGRGKIELIGIAAAFIGLEAVGKLLRHEDSLTTKEALFRETQAINMVDKGRGVYPRMDRNKEFVPFADCPEELRSLITKDQMGAVKFAMDSRDLAVNLCGAPGTGKTFVLGEIRKGLEAAGRKIIALAPSKPAQQELDKVGFQYTEQISTLLKDPDAAIRVRDRTIILDECGMLGAEDGFKLIGLAKHNNARIIFSGDTSQNQSVQAGDLVRTLENERKMNSFEMTESVRFKNPLIKSIVEQMRTDPLGAFNRMVEAKIVQQSKSFFERPNQVANQAKEWGGALIIGPTHDENARSNHAVRQAAEMVDAKKLPRVQDLMWTQAQKKELDNFESGMRLIFHKETGWGKVGVPYEILSRKDRFLLCRDSKGEEVSFSKKQMDACNVFKADEVPVSKGDKIVFLANSKGAFKATNGEQAVVVGFDESGRVMLEGGRTVPADFQQWNLGYAITAQKSQGKTAKKSVLSGNFRREQGFVAASRSQDDMVWFVDDIEMASEMIQISNARTSATELARMMQYRGRYAGGDMAAQSATGQSVEESTQNQSSRQRGDLDQHLNHDYKRGRYGSSQDLPPETGLER